MLTQQKTETQQKQYIYKSVIYNSSEDEEDEEDIEERLSEPHTLLKEVEKPLITINKPLQFNLIFKYNKHYVFSNDEKYLITNAFINKYNTNKKLQALTNEYEVIMIIKPTNKHYTHIKYFNFILTTHDYKYFTKQFHAYLDQHNNITNITEITEYIENVI